MFLIEKNKKRWGEKWRRTNNAENQRGATSEIEEHPQCVEGLGGHV